MGIIQENRVNVQKPKVVDHGNGVKYVDAVSVSVSPVEVSKEEVVEEVSAPAPVVEESEDVAPAVVEPAPSEVAESDSAEPVPAEVAEETPSEVVEPAPSEVVEEVKAVRKRPVRSKKVSRR